MTSDHFGDIFDNKVSLSLKKNWASDKYTADTVYWFWPDDEQTVFENKYTDFRLNTQIKYYTKKWSTGFQLDSCDLLQYDFIFLHDLLEVCGIPNDSPDDIHGTCRYDLSGTAHGRGPEKDAEGLPRRPIA